MAKPSAFSALLPLIIVFVILGLGGWIGYQVWLSAGKIRDTASERMSRRHKSVVFTKDGVRVGVKQMKNENYVDKTQSFVVKAWNLGTTKEEQQQSEVTKRR